MCTKALEATLADDPNVKLSTFSGKTCESTPIFKDYKVPHSPQIARSSITVNAAQQTYQITVWTVKGHIWRTNSDFQTVQLK